MPAAEPARERELEEEALKVAIAPDHMTEAVRVPPESAVPVVLTMRSSALALALLPAVPLLDWALATEVKELSKVFNVGALLR